MDCSPPCSSVLGILQARILEAVAISSSQRIFPTQGSNPRPLCLLHWQEDSLPLHHLGSLLMPRDPQILISSCVSTSVHARAHTHTHTHTHNSTCTGELTLSVPTPTLTTYPAEPLKETGLGPQRYTTPETCPQSSCLRTSPLPLCWT